MIGFFRHVIGLDAAWDRGWGEGYKCAMDHVEYVKKQEECTLQKQKELEDTIRRLIREEVGKKGR